MTPKISIKILLVLFFLSVPGSILAQRVPIEDGIEIFENREFENAVDFFRKYVKRNPSSSTGYCYLGRAEMETGNLEQAEDELRKSAALAPRGAEPLAWLGRTILKQAEEANRLRRRSLAKTAREHLEKSLSFDAKNVTALESLALAHLSFPGGKIDRALELAQRLEKLDEAAGLWIVLRIHAQENPSPQLEGEYLRLAALVGDDVRYVDFFDAYGYFLLNLGRNAEALVQFEKQVELHPGRALPLNSLGDGYRALGRLEDAKRAYREALAIDPDLSTSKKSLAKVEKELARQ